MLSKRKNYMNTHWGKTYDQILNYLKTIAICFLMGWFAGDAIRLWCLMTLPFLALT